MIRLLAAPRLALGVIGAMVLNAVVAVGPPAAGFGAPLGERPFTQLPFVGLAVLLFLCTASCTWLRGAAVLALWRGLVPANAVELRTSDPAEIDEFLHQAGFRKRGKVHRRNWVAIGAGWLLHIGLLSLMAGIGVQLLWHDGGAFEVAVGETVDLSEPGAVFSRSTGPLASERPLRLRVLLMAYDPHLHQEGYAPDRSSRLWLETEDGFAREVILDRVKGVKVAGTTVFQAMPGGIALIIELPGPEVKALHLQQMSEHHAEAELTDPAGESVRVIVDSEHGLDDRRGTGALTIRLVEDERETPLDVGGGFVFGGTDARLAGVVRWSGFTYERSPGMPAVFAGFAIVLMACTLLAIPAGVARVEGRDDGVVARVWLSRGAAVLASDWRCYNTQTATEGNGRLRVGARSPTRRKTMEG